MVPSEANRKCSKCNLFKSVERFSRDRLQRSGFHSWCKPCRKKHQQTERGRRSQATNAKKYRQTKAGKRTGAQAQARQRAKFPERIKAMNAVRKLVKPDRCEECPETVVEAHHDDYSKPLQVVWLCREHHLAKHGKRLVRLLP